MLYCIVCTKISVITDGHWVWPAGSTLPLYHPHSTAGVIFLRHSRTTALIKSLHWLPSALRIKPELYSSFKMGPLPLISSCPSPLAPLTQRSLHLHLSSHCLPFFWSLRSWLKCRCSERLLLSLCLKHQFHFLVSFQSHQHDYFPHGTYQRLKTSWKISSCSSLVTLHHLQTVGSTKAETLHVWFKNGFSVITTGLGT